MLCNFIFYCLNLIDYTIKAKEKYNIQRREVNKEAGRQGLPQWENLSLFS